MRFPGGILSILLLVLPLRPISAQDLSTYVCPSEDEWLEAMNLGEISYTQYLCLSEIARNGIDSNSLYLLDEIPNLAYFLDTLATARTPLEQEQQEQVTASEVKSRAVRSIGGRFDYRYIQRIQEEEKSSYRSNLRLDIADNLTAFWKINRETSGRERIVYRSIAYSNRKSPVRSFKVGNFTARLGLGTLFGYRGKLLNRSDRIDGESLAFPDYGGYNGVHVVARAHAFEVQVLGSLTRDRQYRLASGGVMIKRLSGAFRPGLILGFNQMVERGIGRRLDVPMFALHGEYRYVDGFAVVEIGRQSGPDGRALGAVVEGKHRLENIEVRFAGWSYSRRFKDLTSGSKAGSVYGDCYLEDVEFEYSSKRAGQKGALLKTSAELSREVRAVGSLLAAGRDRSNQSVQFSHALVRSLGRRSSVQLDYLWRRRIKVGVSSVSRTDRGRWRLEGRFNSGDLYLRSYIGYNTDSERRSYLSLFATIKINLRPAGFVQFWSNFHRFGAEGLEYWYLFICGEQAMIDNVKARFKLAHTYRNNPANRGQTTLSLGVVADL